MYSFAFIGPQRTGKTTLVQMLEALNAGAELPDCEFYIAREAATDLIREHGENIVKDPRFQDMLFEKQTAREDAARALVGQFGGTWVADRTIIDNIAFIFYLRKLNPLQSEHPEEDFPIKENWLEYIRAHPFDIVYICDPADIELQPGMNIAWSADDIDAERAIRMEVFECYKEALRFLGISYELLSGTPEERLAIVREAIAELNLIREGVLVAPEGAVGKVEIK